jgi:hypothetical protein
VSHNTPRSLLVKELANELEKRGLSYWLEEWDLVSVIHFSRQSNWRLANATPAWRSLVRIKISAALPCFLCLVVSICSPLTSKAQGTVEAKTNSLPEWRWEAVIAALEDPSIEVQQAAVEWLAALSEQRYAPPKAPRLKDFVNCSKPVSFLRIQMGFMFCEHCPGLIPRAPAPRRRWPVCSRIPMKAFAWRPPRRLEAGAQQR